MVSPAGTCEGSGSGALKQLEAGHRGWTNTGLQRVTVVQPGGDESQGDYLQVFEGEKRPGFKKKQKKTWLYYCSNTFVKDKGKIKYHAKIFDVGLNIVGKAAELLRNQESGEPKRTKVICCLVQSLGSNGHYTLHPAAPHCTSASSIFPPLHHI